MWSHSNKQFRAEPAAVEEQRSQAEARANKAEERLTAAIALFTRLFAEEKRRRILAAAIQWSEQQSAFAAISARPSLAKSLKDWRQATVACRQNH